MSFIAVEDLTFRFPAAAVDALREITLEIQVGEFVIVTGRSGCGKSTLALALGGYLFSQYAGTVAGSVRVGSVDVRRAPAYDVAEVVGLVQQNPEAQFCTLTVQDEVAFGLENRCLAPAAIQHQVAWSLDMVGATHLRERALVTLSGGEKQKVAIAAILAARPQVLIFDEPTSNLDPTATAEIFRVIARLREEAALTVIVIEHKLHYLRAFSPRLIRMAAGAVIADGPMIEAHPVSLGASACMERASCGEAVDDARPVVAHVENLTVGYNGEAIVRDLSLTLRAGEFVALMGDNGSGKTTFLQSLLGLLKPMAGYVKIVDADTRDCPISHLARHVGFVFQNPDHQLFAESVWEEAIFAPRNFGQLDTACRAAAQAMLARARLAGREMEHPYRLSYGEKRRLNLIAVLTYASQLLLLDEPLVGQDAENVAFLMALLCDQVRQGKTVVMVNHNPEVTCRYASRLIFFAGGRLLVDAPPAEAYAVLAAQGYTAYIPPAYLPAEGGL